MKNLLVLIGIVVFTCLGYTQELQRSISGTVTDGERPLSNVSINILKKTKGTTTDSLGKFRLEVNKKDILQFRHLGMSPLKLKAKKLRAVNVIEMSPLVERLKEVTLKAKAKSRQKLMAQQYPANYNIIRTKFGYIDRDRTAYTMRIIEGDKLFKGAINFMQALRVYFPQIRIVDPFSNPKIYVRPNNSFRNTQPAAFELDGMFLEKAPTGLTISEIDRIAIISSSSIAAKYGAAASGGIIIINTKGSNW